MLLHNKKEKFIQLIEEIAEETGIDEAIIEKDYFVTLFLRELVMKEPLLVFKGGTCLSKCFKLIKRFSEDIDINLDGVKELTQSRKKQLRDHIVSVIDGIGLTHINPEQIKSGMDYNLYRVAYPASFENPALKQYLEVESVFRIGAFPTEKMQATSLVYDYLKNKGNEAAIKAYGLEPFEVRVQALERTFVDKIFAICDYYILGRVTTYSRHLYDLYKILPLMTLDNKLKEFVEEVRLVREGKRDCPSADKGVSLSELLEKILAEETYKNDYDGKTAVLLYEKVSYSQAIETVQKIAEWLK